MKILIGRINKIKVGYTGHASILPYSVVLTKNLCKLSLNEIAKRIAKEQNIKNGYIDIKISFEYMIIKKTKEDEG